MHSSGPFYNSNTNGTSRSTVRLKRPTSGTMTVTMMGGIGRGGSTFGSVCVLFAFWCWAGLRHGSWRLKRWSIEFGGSAGDDPLVAGSGYVCAGLRNGSWRLKRWSIDSGGSAGDDRLVAGSAAALVGYCGVLVAAGGLGYQGVLGPMGLSSLAGCIWLDPMGSILADWNGLAAATMARRRHEDGAGLSAHGPRRPRWDGPRWDLDCAVSQNKTRDGTIHIYIYSNKSICIDISISSSLPLPLSLFYHYRYQHHYNYHHNFHY